MVQGSLKSYQKLHIHVPWLECRVRHSQVSTVSSHHVGGTQLWRSSCLAWWQAHLVCPSDKLWKWQGPASELGVFLSLGRDALVLRDKRGKSLLPQTSSACFSLRYSCQEEGSPTLERWKLSKLPEEPSSHWQYNCGLFQSGHDYWSRKDLFLHLLKESAKKDHQNP